jgi:hypothetical protein
MYLSNDQLLKYNSIDFALEINKLKLKEKHTLYYLCDKYHKRNEYEKSLVE